MEPTIRELIDQLQMVATAMMAATAYHEQLLKQAELLTKLAGAVADLRQRVAKLEEPWKEP